MKLNGTIGDYEVVVLIDPGATHNFVSLELIKELGLPVEPTGSFGVCLGNGDSVQGNGICRKMKLQLEGGVEVISDFLPLGLGNSNIILGVQWLETLGVVMTDWKKQEMTYNIQGNPVTLTGDPSLMWSKISLKAMIKSMQKLGGGFVVECRQMEAVALQQTETCTPQTTEEKSGVPEFLKKSLQQYNRVFEEPQGLPPKRAHEHAIRLKEGSSPVGVRPYRYPQSQKDEIERLIKDMALNKETVPDKYPIPVIDELLDELNGATVFSKLDLKAKYHQIRVREEDTHKTAFRTHDGHYEFLVMPFGLMNAPATFQSLMNDVFRPFLRKFVLVFFDDILVYSKNKEEQSTHLETILAKLKDHSLVANRKKCEFGKESIGYLGHVISHKGVEVDQDKIIAILDWPQPTNLRELRSFLGMTVQKWKYYLLGRHFVVRSDQQRLHFLTQQREIKADYQRWVAKLLGFDFEIQFKPGAANRVVDALSRKKTGEVVLREMVSIHGVSWEQLDREIAADKDLQLIMQGLKKANPEPSKFHLVDGKLRYKGRIVVPRSSKVVTQLLEVYHDSPVGGHAGEVKMYLRLAGEWYWKGMREDMTAYVKKCMTCQQQKVSQQSPTGLLQPLPIPTMVWEDITMDFIGLPMSQGYNDILVVVDRLTKYAHFLGLRHPFDAFSVAKVFIKEIVKLHGFPGSIVSDRDRIFISTFWKELFKLQGSTLKRSTAYHPQTDGQTENVNKGLETYLRCFVGGKPKTWAKWLHWAEYSYNTAPHLSTKITPFKALYGREAPPVLRIDRGQATVNSVEKMLLERDHILDDLQFHLHRSQQRMKQVVDAHRREESFEVGDWVFLKLQPYRQQSLAKRPFEKLAARYYGPFKVILAFQSYLEDRSSGLSLNAELEMMVEPEELLEVRQVQQGPIVKMEALIKWKGLPRFEATWEDVERTALQFPVFHLEDKVNLWGRGNVIPQVSVKQPMVYSRRKNKAGRAKE
ncbi:hypothetical protein AgCh_032491 [Apium graveolens]